jgi:hypothetical protein
MITGSLSFYDTDAVFSLSILIRSLQFNNKLIHLTDCTSRDKHKYDLGFGTAAQSINYALESK